MKTGIEFEHVQIIFSPAISACDLEISNPLFKGSGF